VAEEISEELEMTAAFVEGARGEFSVRVDGEVVIRKEGDSFPTPPECVDAIVRRIG
jgi:hypothetical protein